MKLRSIFLALLFYVGVEAHMLHCETVEPEWKEENLSPFDELILSWNAARPAEGKYLFYVSAKIEEWSPWLLYASWGSEGQESFLSTTAEAPVRTYQDALEVQSGKKATGFRVKVVPEGSAVLEDIRGLHVYVNSDRDKKLLTSSPSLPIYLEVEGLSQMVLHHVRHKDLCSPTSTTAVVRYLSNNSAVDPIRFAAKAWDGGFDIFGNWVFNVAQASVELGPTWKCWVERLAGFEQIYERLQQKAPVVVSVRSPLPGSAQPYNQGHLIAVIGYDPQEQKVLCMDPAFPRDSQTFVFYDLSDFIQAWNRRGRIAYVFEKSP